jgi:serine/threonine-protein kinase
MLGVLGRGGMGVVYKARHRALGRLVALKMILSGNHADPLELARFRVEAEALARLQHPNIVQIFEVGDHEGRPFFALEFVEGGNLAAKLGGVPLPPREAARMIETLARAVHAAHERKVIHRDLKPANVLLTPDGTPKVTDFGLAKRLDAGSDLTQANAVMGTPSYMAPELALGKAAEVGPAADVYALGALLYEALTGRPPFRAASSLETLQQVLTDDPVAPRRLQARIPRDLETVCLKCLEKQVGRRCASALELAEELRRFQAGEPVRARRYYRLRRAWRRIRWLAVAALAVAAAVGLLWLELTRGATKPPDEPQSLATRRACPPVPWEPLPVEDVDGKPRPRDMSGFDVLENSGFLDFSRWRPVPPNQLQSGRVDPTFLTTVLRLRKHLGQPNNKELIWQYRSSGYAVDPRCANRPCRVRRYSYLETMPDDRQGQVQKTMTVWEGVIDVSDAGNDGEPFDVTINAIYWNAFHDQENGRPGEWMGIRLDYPAADVNQTILMPGSKRLKSCGFSAFPKDTERPLPSEQAPGSVVDQARGKLYWEIPDPKQDWVYRIDWSWQDR